MKYLSFAGVALVVIVLVAIPQLQYRKNKETYFLVVEDYEAYKKKTGAA
jgi:PTS system ascorbate-specific IIC component